MYLTRSDFNIFYYLIHREVAKKLRIQDYEWKSTSELSKDIHQSNSNISSILNKFIKVYEDWFNVHDEINKSGSAGMLTHEQNKKLIKTIKDRDSTRKELISQIENL